MMTMYENVRNYAVLACCVCLLASCCGNSNPTQAAQGTPYKKRAEVFQGLYGMIISKYVNNNILQIPAGTEMNAQSPGGSQTAPLHLNFDAIDLGDNPKDVILLHDMADIGDGSIRMILFADGHIEAASVWK